VIDGEVRRTVSSASVSLAVIEAGDRRRPTIVLVHGYPDTKEVWGLVIACLAPRFHVAAYDVRGAGGSSAPRGPAAFGMECLADDLLAVIDAVAPGGRAHLVGHDWGGIAGWELAAMARVEARLASFTTIAGPPLRQLSATRGRLLEAARRLRRSWYVLALCTPGVPTLAWRLVLGRRWRRYLELGERVPIDAEYPASTLTADAIRGANLYRRNILGRVGRRGPPAVVRIPAQLIVPSADRFVSPTYYAHAERSAPGLRRRTVPGSHWAPRSQPELLAQWIAEFVEESECDGAGSLRAPQDR
jgi:pimeloyl-ACP methyl ester carboxylesterase